MTRYQTYVNADGPPVLEETPLSGGGIWDVLGTGFDALAAGQKGRLVTGGLVASGLARNPAALTAHFLANQAAINGYIDQINTGKAIQLAMTPRQGPSPVLTFLAGLAVGGAAVYFLTQE